MKLRSIFSGLALCAAVAASAAAPKYVFYFIGDGMGMGPVMSAANYNRTVVGTTELPLMMTFPVAGIVTTYSASSPVTDSAAAGTALATGRKTGNGMLGVTADTVSVRSIAAMLKDHGYGVGLVTNVAPDDATPGAFYAHVPKRSMAAKIDSQFVESNVDFLAGAAFKGFDPADATDYLAANGVTYCKGIDAFNSAKADAKRVLLLDKAPFSKGNTGYVVDSIPGMLTLPQMTAACIEHLGKVSPDRFFMMVEGGNIDHALHGNDGAAAIAEIFNFNNALRVAYDFLLAHPDETLIVVTADHDTGGMSVGNAANGYTANYDVLSNQRISKEMFSDLCKDIQKKDSKFTWEEMKTLLSDKFGFWNTVKLSEKQTEQLEKLYAKVFEQLAGDDQKTLYNNFNAFAAKVFDIVSAKAAVGWTTMSHTGNPVPVFAVGQGAEVFGKVQDNTEIPAKIMRLAGFDFEN